MAAVKKPTKDADAVPVEDVGKKQNVIMRALIDMGGQPKGFTKATATKVGATGYRVNIFAKNDDDITGRIVYTTFLYV